MKIRTGLLFILLAFGLNQRSQGYPQAGAGTTGSLVNQGGPSLNAIETQSEYDYQVQQAEAQAMARASAFKMAVLNAAAQAEWNEAVKGLLHIRNQELTQLEQEKMARLADLQVQLDKTRTRERQLTDEKDQLDATAAHEQAVQNYKPTDPWRVLDGKLSYAKGDGWVEFTGEILEVKEYGILMHGNFGPPLETGYGERDYFVAGFPHTVADGEKITTNMRFNAFFAENVTFTITNNNQINGGVHTVRGLQYGKVVSPASNELAARPKDQSLRVGGSHPEIDKELADLLQQHISVQNQIAMVDTDYAQKKEQIEANYDARIIQLRRDLDKSKQDVAIARSKAVQDKALKYNEEQAEKGNPVGLLRMGERYRDGDGVPKDLAKARVYLQKAADAGSPSAAEELKNLPANDTAHL